MKTFLTCFLVGLVSLAANAQFKKAEISQIKNKFLDIPYATLSKAEQLDVYLPDEGDGPFPAIVSIHGGAFLGGDKRDGEETPMLEGLKRGYAVVSVNYRLSQEATWPAQIYDCKAAVRWIKANAKKYKLDPDKIAAWGGSAGGQLAALLGTSGGVKSLEDTTMGNPEQSSRVQAVVDWFGPTDFLKMDEQLKESHEEHPLPASVPNSPASLLLGKNIVDVPDLVRQADPDTYISADDPPFLIQHGLEDNIVPFEGSILLARKLGRVLGYQKVYLELFPATGHEGPAFFTEENAKIVFLFLDKFMK